MIFCPLKAFITKQNTNIIMIVSDLCLLGEDDCFFRRLGEVEGVGVDPFADSFCCASCIVDAAGEDSESIIIVSRRATPMLAEIENEEAAIY